MKKNGFKIGLFLYIFLWLALTAGLWFCLWNYADAYELAQPKGAMNAYMEERLENEMTVQVAAYSAAAANDYQSEEALNTYLTETYLDKEWSYRRSKDSTLESPVYTLYSGDTPVCTAYLTAGEAGPLSFGQKPWTVEPVELELSGLARDITVTAPVGVEVTLNGTALTGGSEAAAQYPGFEENAPDIKVPLEVTTYTVEHISLTDLTVAAEGDYVVTEVEPDVWYVTAPADEATMAEMEAFAPNFAEKYLMYTSNAGSYYDLLPLVAPEGALLTRLHASLDGMGWVHYTTGKIVELDVSNLTYYGNVFTFDASYLLTLKSGDMAGNMHVVVVQSDYGWRASSVELF